jgi:hypothetical protein
MDGEEDGKKAQQNVPPDKGTGLHKEGIYRWYSDPEDPAVRKR